MAKRVDQFAEIAARQRKLRTQLEVCPVETLRGVVIPPGGSAYRNAGEIRWSFAFTLGAWRTEGRQVKNQERTIRQENLAYKACAKLERALAPYTVIRIRARVLPTKLFGTRQALLEKIVGLDDSDDGLNAIAAKLNEPVTCEDQVLGTLALNRAIGCFVGEAEWRGNRVSVHLQAKGRPHFQKALGVARSLWRTQAGWERRVRAFAVRELLDEAWASEREFVTASDFKKRMRLTAISASPDGSFEFSYDDGGLFWGHEILIRGRLSKGPTTAMISG